MRELCQTFHFKIKTYVLLHGSSQSGSPDASIHIVDLDNGSELGDRDCECYKRYLWSPDSDDLFIAHKSPVPDAMSKVPMQGWRDRFSGGSWVLSNLD